MPRTTQSHVGFPSSGVGSEQPSSTWEPLRYIFPPPGPEDTASLSFPSVTSDLLLSIPDYTKESPARLVKPTGTLLTIDPLQTLWVGLTSKAIPEAEEFCPWYWQALPMSDVAPDTWGPVGKIPGKLEMVRASGHWVRGLPLGE